MTNKPEIDVKRRRKGEKPVSQAQAPVRRRVDGGSGATSGGGAFGKGGALYPSKGKLGGCGTIILIAIFVIYFLLTSDNQPASETPVYPQETEPVSQPAIITATRTPRPTLPASNGKTGQSWLVMLYQDADDQTLEQDIFLDLNEAERAGSTDQVKIVAQLDRFRGGFSGDEDWRSTRRYLVTQDDDLNSIGSELIEDLGEINMADGNSLVDFVTWAVQAYPADHYALILSDHGMGWPGGWSDPAPGGTDAGGAPLVKMMDNDSIFLSELDTALADIQNATGIEKLDLIGMDACLMSQLEVFMALQPYARYAVASEETEPGLGWAYAAFLNQVTNNPGMDGAQLAEYIVDTYIDQDQRIVDDQARAEFLSQNGSTGGFFSFSRVTAEQLADQLERNITLTAVDLDAIVNLNQSFNNFAYVLQDVDQQLVASARNYTQSFTSIFGKQVPPSYIDLGHFAKMVVEQTGDAAIRQAAEQVIEGLNNSIIAEKHGKSKPGSTGIAIYFPNSTLYRSPYTGLQSYTMIAERFSKVSLWDDFLVYHYNNRTFSADAVEAVVPPSGGTLRSPGSGDISISQMTASSSVVSPGGSIKISAEISGNNIGYIYFFTGYFDAQSNSIYVADTDYLESTDTKALNEVYYPVWPQSDSFIMNFDWEPTLFSITDGSQSILALFTPAAYGASAEEATYTVDGIYTFAVTGETRQARLYFRDGKLFQVFGFMGGDTASAPAEISPVSGDTFTLSQKWMDLDTAGNITEIVYQSGETLTFSGSPFEWEQVYAPDGEYFVGFLVSDLDGNLKEAYTQITVH